jgi:excisionase family DNA binding protein
MQGNNLNSVASVYWTPDELAGRLRVKAGVVRDMCRRGTLKARRVGQKLWRIPEQEVKRLYPELFNLPSN